MSTSAEFVLDEERFHGDPATPRWIRDVLRFLPLRSQFLLSGNTKDRQPFPVDVGRYAPMSLAQYLTEVLVLRGYDHVLTFNPVEGFSVLAPRGADPAIARAFFEKECEMQWDAAGRCRCSLDRAASILERVTACRDRLLAVVVEFASRIPIRNDGLSEREHEFFTRLLVMGLSASPHVTSRVREAHYNVLLWVCDRENDLPGWMVLDNPRLRPVILPKPDHRLRGAMIRGLAPSLAGYREASADARQLCERSFIEQTEGLCLADVVAISQLARRERLACGEIGEAVRRYKLGVTEDPWKHLDRDRIRGAEGFITQRVKGQRPAVVKALDILKRAVTGLSGAQASASHGRPRGVLFLAGPTGVGKTELAKTLTELLFGDERAYIRFDMSEFSSEHADQRLIGAPPGYVGYDAGGELTNAIREKPFAVVLFDEIEKAHPRILDKFLQLLDDGVLTSGRGERVYFSEAVVVFTSNLGIHRIDASGDRVPTVTPADSYAVVEQRVRSEIERHFKTQLNRPELLNRLGDNIVVFDFIRAEVARQIYDKMVQNILTRLAQEQQVTVSLAPKVQEALLRLSISDLGLGGRGVGNKLEAWLINPLSRALFDQDVQPGSMVSVVDLSDAGGVPEVRLDLVRSTVAEASREVA